MHFTEGADGHMTRVFLMILPVTFAAHLVPAQQPSLEYLLKSVNLYKICKFTTWPPQLMKTDTFYIKVIGSLGKDQIISVPSGKTIHDCPVSVTRITSPREILPCHALFIARSESPRVGPLVEFAMRHDILTFGDSEEFVRQGVMVTFVIENDVIRFRINLDALNATRLKVHSRLLELSDLISQRNN